MSDAWTIYYNPKCSKCRQTLELLKQNEIEPKVIEYLKIGIDEKQMEEIITQSGAAPETFLRKKETEFSDFHNSDISSPSSVAKTLSKCPKLLERPVVINGERVVIARPPELVKEIM